MTTLEEAAEYVRRRYWPLYSLAQLLAFLALVLPSLAALASVCLGVNGPRENVVFVSYTLVASLTMALLARIVIRAFVRRVRVIHAAG